jgi:hypothetical protein
MDMVFRLTRASDIEADPYLGVVNVMVGWFGRGGARRFLVTEMPARLRFYKSPEQGLNLSRS